MHHPSTIRVIVAASLFAMANISGAEPSTQVMSAADFVELERVGQPSLSPDRTHIVYQRQHVLWEENDAVDRLRIVNVSSGGDQLLMDPVKPDEDFGGIEWHPDGTGFITILKRNDDEARQAYFFRLADRSLTRLTAHPVDVGNISYAPDGSGFYFIADRELDDAATERLKDGWTLRAYDSGPGTELWFFETETANSTRIIDGDDYIRGYTVAHDGKHVLYALTNHTLGDRQDSELWLYDVRSKNSKQITHNAHAEYKASLSPKNNQIAYLATINEKGEHYFEDNVFVLDVKSGTSELLLSDAAMEIVDIEWDRDGSGIYLLGNTGLRTQLYHLTLATQQLQPLTAGDHEVRSWTYDAITDSHVYIKRDARSPGEIWYRASRNEPERQITHEYDDLDETFRLPRQEMFHWEARDGSRLEGLLVYPVDYRPGKPFPLITTTHGGPRSSSQFGSWNLSRAVPVFAGEGYGIFLPNHRGGTGYGDAFMRDMVGGYFNNAHLDVLDGIDALVSANLADPDQLIKMGWSAGGHMTNKLITYTKQFRAASSGAGASDWTSMYAESDVRFNRTPWFGGTPWQQDAPLQSFSDQSFLKDSWKVTTPTLFFVGERDVRVPPTQSIMMHRGVRAAGVESELYIAPREPHNYGRPKHQLFKINTELSWFAKHLGRKPYAAAYPDIDAQEAP